MISEKRMPIAWYTKRWWTFCMTEDEKKEREPISIEQSFSCAAVTYNSEVLKHFVTLSYTKRLDIVQKYFWISSHFGTKIMHKDFKILLVLFFGTFFSKRYVINYLK